MDNQKKAQVQQSTIDPMYRNLAGGKTPQDKLQIICENAIFIDALCDLIEGFDTTISSEPISHATFLIQRLAREITLNQAGLSDYLTAIGGKS